MNPIPKRVIYGNPNPPNDSEYISELINQPARMRTTTITNSANLGATTGTVNTGLEDIMNEFRVGDKKSNIIQIDTNQYFQNDPVVRIATLLEQSNNLSNKIYRLNFDPVQEIVLKKMVGEDMLNKRLIIEANDFFKGLLTLNYYCSVIAKSYDVVDSLHDYALKLERLDRSRDPLIKDVVEYILMDSFKKNIFVGDNIDRSAKSAYISLKRNVDLSGVKFTRVSPIYTSAANIIKDTVPNLYSNVSLIDSRIDLNALVFIDTIYPYIRDDNNLSKITSLLVNKDFLNASINALQIASKKYYNDHIDKKIRGGL
ncbi:MAG: hypothetical protein ACP5N1_07165 [Candidatus Woesearchaeota archaeon]